MTTPNRILTLAVVLLSLAVATRYLGAEPQVLTPPPGELRYQALLNEPIATPDQKAVVAGTSALLIKDRQTGRCFLAVSIGNEVGLSPAECVR